MADQKERTNVPFRQQTGTAGDGLLAAFQATSVNVLKQNT